MELINNIFKAYDVRGRYPEELNEEVVMKISQALAQHWPKGKIILAHDARLSSPSLYNAVTNELRTHNLELITVGLATTPMFYFLVNKLKAAGGIMVTASHNPKEYNGLKVVGPKAEVISGNELSKLIR